MVLGVAALAWIVPRPGRVLRAVATRPHDARAIGLRTGRIGGVLLTAAVLLAILAGALTAPPADRLVAAPELRGIVAALAAGTSPLLAILVALIAGAAELLARDSAVAARAAEIGLLVLAVILLGCSVRRVPTSEPLRSDG